MSLSLVSSTVSRSYVLFYPPTHFSLGLPFLRLPSGSHSRILCGSLLPDILLTRSEYFFSSNIQYLLPYVNSRSNFGCFLFLTSLNMSSKTPSQLQVVYYTILHLVSLFLHHVRDYFGLWLGKYSFFFVSLTIFIHNKTELFNMAVTLIPWLIFFFHF